MGESDDALLDRMERMRPRLRRFASVIAACDVSAENLVGRTVEHAHRFSARKPAGVRLDCWLFGIMKDIWLSDAGQAGEINEGSAPEGLSLFASVRARPAIIASAVHGLSEDQRIAVGLVLVERLPYSEAAAVAGISVGALTSCLSRARQILQVRLGMRLGNIDEYVSEEILTAYADGELDPVLHTKVMAMISAHPDLAVRIAAYKDLVLRLQITFEDASNCSSLDRAADSPKRHELSFERDHGSRPSKVVPLWIDSRPRPTKHTAKTEKWPWMILVTAAALLLLIAVARALLRS